MVQFLKIKLNTNFVKERLDKNNLSEIIKIELDLDNPFFIFKTGNKWVNNGFLSEDRLNFICDEFVPLLLDETQKEELKKVLEKEYKFSKRPEMDKQASQIAKSLDKVFSNLFYKDVKMQVNVTMYKDHAFYKYAPQTLDRWGKPLYNPLFEVFKASYSNTEEKPEIILNIIIDQKTDKITIRHKTAVGYLEEYESKWKKEVKARGRDYNIKKIRSEVLSDFESAETEHSFYEKFIQNSKALLSDKIGGYAEAILATQKITKHVWAEGTVNQSIWHTQNEEYGQWPAYVQVDPVIGGLEDGIIDEIVGIPLAVKAIYEIATEKEKRAALAGLFSKEGIKNLYGGLLDSAEDTLNDSEKTEHFVGVASVNVISMMSGIGFIGKSKKIVDSAEEITGFVEQITNPKVLEVLERIRKSDIKNPQVFHAVEDFLQKMDPKTLDVLADAPGFDKAIKEMSSQWSKFHGGKFVMDYASERVGKGKTIKFEVETLDRSRCYDIQFEEFLPSGRKLVENLELKNWTGFWGETIKSQFTKDLGKMNNLGDVKWVFNKKGINQSMDELRQNVIKNLKKADGSPIDELSELFNETEKINKIQKVFGKGVTNPSELINKLNTPETFKQIFEIVE